MSDNPRGVSDRATTVHSALNHPPCAYTGCGAPMRPRQYETLRAFNIRITCSEQCRRKYIADRTLDLRLDAEAAHPPCVICNCRVRLRDGEGITRYKARPTCSEDCRRQLVSQTLKGKPLAWSHGERAWKERGSFDGDFSRHNVKTNDDGKLTVSKPDPDYSYSGSSLA